MLGVVGLTGAGGFDVLGWHAAPDFAGADLGVLVTRAPAATMAPSPISQPSSRVAPMPMRAWSWMVQAWTVTLWPMVT